jgi:uncharacterized SAM-binding protein YcdF (DUF218 family)
MTIISTLRKRPKRYIIAIIFAIALCVSGLYLENILKSIGDFLILEDQLKKTDIIIVLAGSIPDRTMEAADIYNDGYSKKILLTKEILPRSFEILLAKGVKIPEGYDINKIVLTSLGVSDDDIESLDKRVQSTYEEASAVKDFLMENGYDSFILVTSKTHSRRAYLTFHSFLGNKIEIINKPTKYDDFNPDTWWTKRKDAKELFFAYIKMMFYSIYYNIWF